MLRARVDQDEDLVVVFHLRFLSTPSTPSLKRRDHTYSPPMSERGLVRGPVEVTLRFPGTPAFLRLARLAAADAGSRAGFDYDEIEDLRVAVSELAAMMGGGDGSPIGLVLTLTDGRVAVEASGDGPGAASPEEEFARALIEAVVDEFEVIDHEGAVGFRIAKARRPRDG